jgi:hypothetical protein
MEERGAGGRIHGAVRAPCVKLGAAGTIRTALCTEQFVRALFSLLLLLLAFHPPSVFATKYIIVAVTSSSVFRRNQWCDSVVT